MIISTIVYILYKSLQSYLIFQNYNTEKLEFITIINSITRFSS